MIVEGRIVIELGKNGDVGLTSNRGVDIARLLIGRSAEEVLDLLPRLFSLCGHAHVAAARHAMQQHVSADEARADTLLVLAEAAREHLLRILTGWGADGAEIAMPAPPVMGLVSGMQAAIGDPGEERQVAALLSNYLEVHVLGISPTLFLRLRDLAGFTAWLDDNPTPAKAFLRHLVARGWQDLGAVSTRFLPDLAAAELQTLLARPSFTTRPEWLDQPHETGPLTRQSKQPLVAAIQAQHGAGLLTRLVARLVDLAMIPTQMMQCDCSVRRLPGLGIVETARGRLVHSAKLKSGKIAEYRILSPTDWNFHPAGVVVQALKGLQDDGDRTERANVVIEAIDPCVAFEVRAA